MKLSPKLAEFLGLEQVRRCCSVEAVPTRSIQNLVVLKKEAGLHTKCLFARFLC